MTDAMDPDLVLLARWRAGDARAAEDLFGRHFASVYRFFDRKVGDDADDLVQRTFLACVAAREQFRSQSSFRTYLFAIARNELYAHLRRLPRDRAMDFDVTSIAEIVTPQSARLDRARAADRLQEALRALPAEQQLLLELHYWHDLDALALGEIFSATPGTIRVRLLRGRQALRQQLERIGPPAMADAATDRLTASLLEREPEEADAGTS